VLGLDGEGGAEMFADYWQWEQARFARKPQPAKPAPKVEAPSKPPDAGRKRLSYMEGREYEQMEERILSAEKELDNWKAAIQASDVVADGRRLQEAYEKMQAAQQTVDSLYARWAELEAKIG
jgi:ATP-binding cassette subfamily F protein uup